MLLASCKKIESKEFTFASYKTKDAVPYDIYFDEGYEVRTIQGRVFNIVFTKKYNKPVIEGFKLSKIPKEHCPSSL